MEETYLSRLTGTVIHGHGRGRTVGMPTANLAVDGGSALPPDGVYATLAYVDGAAWMGVTNVGRRPSVDDDSAVTVETLVLDFTGDLYGRPMAVEFYQFLRPVEKFASLQAVKEQVDRDKRAVRAYFGERGWKP